MSKELHCNPSCVYLTSMDTGMVCLKHHREALAAYEKAGPDDPATALSLFYFEAPDRYSKPAWWSDKHIDVLVIALRAAWKQLADTRTAAVQLAQDKQDEIFKLRKMLQDERRRVDARDRDNKRLCKGIETLTAERDGWKRECDRQATRISELQLEIN